MEFLFIITAQSLHRDNSAIHPKYLAGWHSPLNVNFEAFVDPRSIVRRCLVDRLHLSPQDHRRRRRQREL